MDENQTTQAPELDQASKDAEGILEYSPPPSGALSANQERVENRLEDVWGNFTMVTAKPTWQPKQTDTTLAFDTTTAKLYYYDFTNNVWKTLGGNTVYGGRVATDAAANTLPTGWSASVNAGTKVYTVTHNLGSASYSVVATAIDSNATTYYIPFLTFNANTFTVEFDTLSAVAGETDWTFILTLIT